MHSQYIPLLECSEMQKKKKKFPKPLDLVRYRLALSAWALEF